MTDNLKIYNAVRNPPSEALKTIKGGRLSGYTDINPMWRIKALTEKFGVCGIGWKYTITKQWIEEGAKGEKCAFTNIDLFIKIGDEWSDAIPGTGGSSFIANEKSGPYTSDECFKMSLTDAISVACKALGFAADIYWNSDRSKYDKPEYPMPEQPKKIDDTKAQVIYDLLGKTNSDVKAFLSYYKVSKVEDMTIDVWTKATKALQGKLNKGEG
jgi:hypothetical protein